MSRAGTGVRGAAAAGGGAGGRGSQAARHPQPTQLILLLFPGTVSFRLWKEATAAITGTT
jgi:hypothetical protein